MVTWNPTEFASWPIVEYLAWFGSKMLDYINIILSFTLIMKLVFWRVFFQILLTWQASIFQPFLTIPKKLISA
jgi:hypothetical protein